MRTKEPKWSKPVVGFSRKHRDMMRSALKSWKSAFPSMVEHCPRDVVSCVCLSVRSNYYDGNSLAGSILMTKGYAINYQRRNVG